MKFNIKPLKFDLWNNIWLTKRILRKQNIEQTCPPFVLIILEDHPNAHGVEVGATAIFKQLAQVVIHEQVEAMDANL